MHIKNVKHPNEGGLGEKLKEEVELTKLLSEEKCLRNELWEMLGKLVQEQVLDRKSAEQDMQESEEAAVSDSPASKDEFKEKRKTEKEQKWEAEEEKEPIRVWEGTKEIEQEKEEDEICCSEFCDKERQEYFEMESEEEKEVMLQCLLIGIKFNIPVIPQMLVDGIMGSISKNMNKVIKEHDLNKLD